jgi:hypothetical protein
MLADEEREWLAEKGRERQRAGKSANGDAGGRGRKKPGDRTVPEVSGGAAKPAAQTRARDSAAKAHNVSSRKVQQAQAVKSASPELAEKVKNGEVPLAQAVRQVANEKKTDELDRKAQSLLAPFVLLRSESQAIRVQQVGGEPAVGSPDEVQRRAGKPWRKNLGRCLADTKACRHGQRTHP